VSIAYHFSTNGSFPIDQRIESIEKRRAAALLYFIASISWARRQATQCPGSNSCSSGTASRQAG
jgi:hypothetical protein